MSASVTRVRLRLLCVDDEPLILAGLTRILQPHYEVMTCRSGADALALVEKTDTIPVVVSDLHMPGMSGVELFSLLREKSPDTMRVLLTGNADITSAITAVNDGQIFRFLLKPCPPVALLQVLQAACEQYRLVTSERVLLEQTVQGMVAALTDLLAIVQPEAFGRALRLKRQVAALADVMGGPHRWEAEVAAMLSQVGYIVAPPEVAERVRRGVPLMPAEQHFVSQLPGVAERLIESIPRLEGVRAILHHQDVRWNGGRDVAPHGSRLLKVAQDFDVLEGQGCSPLAAVQALEMRSGLYDPAVLRALRMVQKLPCDSHEQHIGVGAVTAHRPPQVLEMMLTDVRSGMRLAADVVTVKGLVLLARGQEITPHLMERIANVWSGFAGGLRVTIVPPAVE